MIKLALVLALKLYLYLVHWSPHTVVWRPSVMLSCELAGEISCQKTGFFPRI